MAKKSGVRNNIKMVCSEGTGHFYTTTKNKRNTPEKLERRKYNPKLQRHVIYKESNKFK